MHPTCVDRVAALAKNYAAKAALEIGTSRGYLAAVMAGHGCKLTTIDHEDRGARQNLEGLDVAVVVSDAGAFLSQTQTLYSLIVVDLHGNDNATWQALWPQLKPRLDRSGTMVLYNSHLWKMPEWHDQTGLLWVAQNALDGMAQQVFEQPPPGMIVCRHD
jgi:protein-L-isoaspartate O-methyltransferase